jgi:hypothetical protein
MRGVIDTIFNPLLMWLTSIYNNIMELSVPLSRPFDPSKYLGPFALLGPFWIAFITSAFTLGFVYIVMFIIVVNRGVVINFKNFSKWW